MRGHFRGTPFFSIVKYMSPDGFFGVQILPNSITDGEFTVSKSNLVCCSLISVDNKLTLSCLLT